MEDHSSILNMEMIHLINSISFIKDLATVCLHFEKSHTSISKLETVKKSQRMILTAVQIDEFPFPPTHFLKFPLH